VGRHSQYDSFGCGETGVFGIKIQADSVNTGSGMKDGKLEGQKPFSDVRATIVDYVSLDEDLYSGPAKLITSATHETRNRQPRSS